MSCITFLRFVDGIYMAEHSLRDSQGQWIGRHAMCVGKKKRDGGGERSEKPFSNLSRRDESDDGARNVGARQLADASPIRGWYPYEEKFRIGRRIGMPKARRSHARVGLTSQIVSDLSLKHLLQESYL